MIDLFERKKDEAGGHVLKAFYGFLSSLFLVIVFPSLQDWFSPTPYWMMVNLVWGIILAAWIYFTYRVVLYYLALLVFRHEKTLFERDKLL